MAYGEEFFRDRSRSRASAEVVVPLVLDLVHPQSVVDVGCGAGSWLAVFREHGVDDVVAVDGDYVPRHRLEIPTDRFVAHDLERPLELGRRFDLAVSLEVGEHLPEAAAETLVASLVRASDAVLFSAAIPDQRGEHHVNEQWQSWWAKRFAAHGYVVVDRIRRAIWDDERVAWWYAQNVLLYVTPAHPLHASATRTILDVVHPKRQTMFNDGLVTRVRRRLRR